MSEAPDLVLGQVSGHAPRQVPALDDAVHFAAHALRGRKRAPGQQPTPQARQSKGCRYRDGEQLAQILEHAGNAMVAQANQLPQQVLSLLQL